MANKNKRKKLLGRLGRIVYLPIRQAIRPYIFRPYFRKQGEGCAMNRMVRGFAFLPLFLIVGIVFLTILAGFLVRQSRRGGVLPPNENPVALNDSSVSALKKKKPKTLTTSYVSLCTGSNKLQWNGARFTCVPDNDTITTDTNNYPTGISVSGGSDKTITIGRNGLDNISTSFTDNNTTYSAGSGLDLTGTTFSIPTSGITNTMLAGSIASSKLISTDITKLGTITQGTWNGSSLSDAYIDNNITASNYLPLSGGTMSGNVNMGTNNLTNAGTVNNATITGGSLTATAVNGVATSSIVTTGNNVSTLNNDAGYITGSSSTNLTNKTGNNSMWTNDSGYMTASSSNNLTNKTGNISQWTNDSNYITGLDFSQISNGSNIYLNYKPNNIACSDNQTLKYDGTNHRWICADDTDTDTNNYTTSIAFSGTTTKTLTLSRNGQSDLTADFTDNNTTYSAGNGLDLAGTTFSIPATSVTNGMLSGSISASKLVATDIATVGTITSGSWHGTSISDAYIDDNITASNYLPLSGGTMTGDLNMGTKNITTAGTLNGATLSGGTLSGGNVSGGSMSGGTLTDTAVNGVTTTSIISSGNNISLLTNNANYIALTNLTNSATGLTYNNTTGETSLDGTHVIPTTTEESNWNDAYSSKHTQNTDSGTTSQTFQTDSGNSGPKIKNNANTLEVRNSADNAYANLKVQDLYSGGSLYAGSGNVQLTDNTGKIQALSSTYFASLSGSNLTALNASNLSTGTVPSSTISGSYTGITGVGTITAGTWNGTQIDVLHGGTGLTTIASGKLLYTSALNTVAELSLDNLTLKIVAGIMEVDPTGLVLSDLTGNISNTQLPTGGAWTLSSNLNIDVNTLYVDHANSRIGVGTSAPSTTLDVNGTAKAKNILLTNETSAPSQEEGKVYYDANDKQFKLYNSQNGGYTDLAQDPHIAPSYCPDGYVPVPGDVKYGTAQGFCVAKYEMKCALDASPTVGLTAPDTGYHTYNNSSTACATDRAPQSIASGYPIANITQTNAQTYCSNLGTGYHLITNNEWMTIARNVEKNASNWTGGTVGSGGIWRGHTDNDPALALEANSDDSQGYYGTNNTAPSEEKRTFTLSNGKVLWDIAGNVWEWNNDTIRRKDECHTTDRSNGWGWSELTTLDNYGSLSYAQTRPSKPTWNSGQNMGQIYTYSPSSDTDNTLYAFIRGGSWVYGGGAGLFSLPLYAAPGAFVRQPRVPVCFLSVVSFPSPMVRG